MPPKAAHNNRFERFTIQATGFAGGHDLILDCYFGPISDPAQLATRLNERAGIVEHGLFLGLATDVIVAGEEGVRRIERET